MGFLNLFRGKKEEPRATEMPPAEVELSGLPSWLGRELSAKAGEARKKSGEIQEKISRGFEQVRVSAEKLGESEFEKGDKAYAAVNSVKDTFARRVQGLSGKCPAPAGSYSGMREFQKRAETILRELTSITPRQGAILTNYFRKESSSLMKGIKDLNSAVEELRTFLDYEGKPLFLMEEAERISREISGRLESLRNLKGREDEIRQGMGSIREELSGMEEALDAISKNPKWKELKDAEKKREALEGRAEDLRFRIGEELSSAKRPLKKYLHLKAGELSRDGRDFLEGFVKSPLKAMMSGGMEQLKPHLLTLKDMLGGGITLKDREVEKLNELIERIESGKISKSIQEYGGLLREAERMGGEAEREFSGLSEGRRQAESGVNEAREGIRKLESELREMQEKASGLKEEMEKERGGLETLIYENINRKVNIVLETNV